MAVHTNRIAGALIMGGTSFSFPTAPATQGDVLAYHAASAALLPTARAWGIATTSTAGITLANTTAATSGTTSQYSPALQLSGTTWNGSASVVEAWRLEVQPTGGSAASIIALNRSTGGGAYSTVFSVRQDGYIAANSFGGSGQTFTIDSTYMMVGRYNLSTGLGETSNLSSSRDNVLAVRQAGRTDGAGNIVIASIYDRNAASITNAATMFNSLVSWTNNSDAISHQIAGYYTGALWLAGGNSYSDDGSTATGGVHYGAGLNIRSLSAVLTIAAAASTTSTIQIPAGAVVLAVSCRVTTVIPTAATFSVGHAGATTLWGTGISTAATTTNTGAAVPALFASATSLVITPNTAPADNTGRLRVCIHYYLPTAPTS